MKFLTFDEKKVEQLLDEKTSFRLAEQCFRLVAAGRATMPPKLYLDLPGGNDFRAMPAFVGEGKGGGCGLKWVNVFPENRRRGLPTVSAWLLVNSHETGELLAVMEANALTALRTAAAAAVASRYLANPSPSKLAVIGAGFQALYQVKALASLYKLKDVAVWGALEGEAERFRSRYPDNRLPLRACNDIRECVEGADIIVTCTPSRRPLVKKSWVKKGAHINAIGADAPGKQELDPSLVAASKVVVDQWEQASHSGEINVPVSRGLFSKRNLTAELSEIVSRKKKGRSSPKDITVFDSTGLAVLDVYFGHHVYRAALKK